MNFIKLIPITVSIMLLTQLIACTVSMGKNPDKLEPELLIIDRNEINKSRKLAIVNVFINKKPVDINTGKPLPIGQYASLKDVVNLLSSDKKEKTSSTKEFIVSKELAKYTYDKIQQDFSKSFNWQFIPAETVVQSSLINSEPEAIKFEKQRYSEKQSKVFKKFYQTKEQRDDAINNLKATQSNITQGIDFHRSSSYPGKRALKIINRDKKSSARLHLANLARDLNVDAVIAVSVYLLAKDEDDSGQLGITDVLGLFGSDDNSSEKIAVAMNMMMVNSKGKILLNSNRFNSRDKRVWWAEKSASSNLLGDSLDIEKKKTYVSYRNAVDSALIDHQIFINQNINR
ncbi:hypothetical protein [Aliikangiella sp. IMCC44359]|uniref:hypothetical protein n=1 Tax=Aliikangiella sp. IMCC44359 TaxID=3459125 RepID=UPI00403A87D2